MIGRRDWIISHMSPCDDVLDVGCCIEDKYFDDMWAFKDGRMPLHHFLRTYAPKTVGIDISEDRVRELKNRGYNVKLWDAEKIGDYPGRFDVIVASELIEHLSRPVDFLIGASSRLWPGGKIILTTPNAYGFWYFFKYGLRGQQETYTGHVAWLCAEFLRELAKRANLEVQYMDFIGPDPGRRRFKCIKRIPEIVPRLRPIIGCVLKIGKGEMMAMAQMARPNDYKEQNGCWNCQYVLETDHYDAASDFFCIIDGMLQPSLNLDEYVGDKRKLQDLTGRQKVYDKLLKTWHKWADPRQVKEYGICGQWKKREDSDG